MPTPQQFVSHAGRPEAAGRGARIKVVGVGGAGNNALDRMIASGMEGVEFIALNTDVQALRTSTAKVRRQIGSRTTRGYGAGSDPDIGRRAALEDCGMILDALEGAEMVFVTAGLGGGTGTGAAPVIAGLAREMGALTVAIVTRPFGFEGKRRMAIADWGIQHLLKYADTLIVIPNEKLLAIAGDAPFFESFRVADDFLRQAVQGISDIITTPGVINRDFADVKTTMAGMGYAVMGTASRSGPTRAMDAVMDAMASPLLEAGAIDGACGILINMTGSSSLRLSEVNAASTIIQSVAHEDANILFGAVLDERLGDEVKVTVIATGFRNANRSMPRETPKLKAGNQPAAAHCISPAVDTMPATGDVQDPYLQPERTTTPPEEPSSLSEEQQVDSKQPGVYGGEPDHSGDATSDAPVPSHPQSDPGDSLSKEPSSEWNGEQEEEGDWRAAVREIAGLTTSAPGPGILPEGRLIRSAEMHSSTDTDDEKDLDWLSLEEVQDRATLTSVPDAPVAARIIPQPKIHSVLHASTDPAPETRKAAIAAYSMVSAPDSESSRGALPSAFAKILDARRRLIRTLKGERPSTNFDSRSAGDR